MVEILLSVTFGCGVLIAGSHVANRRFIAPVYDVALNLIAFCSAATASAILDHWLSAALAVLAVACWLWLARRTYLALRTGA